MNSKVFQDLCNNVKEAINVGNKKSEQIKKYNTGIWHLTDSYNSMSELEQIKAKVAQIEEMIKQLKTTLDKKNELKLFSHLKRIKTNQEIKNYYINKIITAIDKYDFETLKQDESTYTNNAAILQNEIAIVERLYEESVYRAATNEKHQLIKLIQLFERAEKKEKTEISHKIIPAKIESQYLTSEINKEQKMLKNWK